MAKYLYLGLVALVLSCAGAKVKPCSSAELAKIQAECAALEAIGCPNEFTGDGGQGGAGPELCREAKASCAARVDAWEDCR